MEPELRAQLEAIIIIKDEKIERLERRGIEDMQATIKTQSILLKNRTKQIEGLWVVRKAFWGKLLEFMSDNEIQSIATQAIKNQSCHHEWGTDGQHNNEFCKKCFVNKPLDEDSSCH